MEKELTDFFKDKKVLILGFGREGRTTYEFLKDKVPSAEITVADAKEQKLTSVSPAFLLNRLSAKRYSESIIWTTSAGTTS